MNSRLKKLQSGLLKIGRPLFAAIMPQRCCFCGLPAEGPLCDGCRDDLPWQTGSCPRCALALPDSTPAGTSCATCQLKPPPFNAAVAPLHYAFPIDAAIQALKFHRKLFYLPAMSGLLVEAAERLPPGVDAVLPVPLHRFRLMKRGFNQSLELALPVARALSAPVLTNVRRRIHTPYQSGSNRAERRRNLKSAFVVRGELAASHVLIVDDVITTGETCRELAVTLRQSGAGAVSVLALART